VDVHISYAPHRTVVVVRFCAPAAIAVSTHIRVTMQKRLFIAFSKQWIPTAAWNQRLRPIFGGGAHSSLWPSAVNDSCRSCCVGAWVRTVRLSPEGTIPSYGFSLRQSLPRTDASGEHRSRLHLHR